MSETKFSKGPWKKVFRNGATHIEDADGNSLMCDEQYYPWTPDKDEDWNLIAAAPDMYETLKNLLEMRDKCFIPNDGDWWDKMANDAIAKAEGKGA